MAPSILIEAREPISLPPTGPTKDDIVCEVKIISSSDDEDPEMPHLARMSATKSEGPDAASLQTPDTIDSLDYDDPVVIVGMACRLPGGVSSPHDLWKMLIQERSGQCTVPKERFNIDGFYHPEGDRAGAMSNSGGYFLQEDVRNFENTFFGINNMEATYMDPQQRKMLEVVYECFESSGNSLEDVAGGNIGVYVGNFTVDFQTMQTRDPEYMHRYSATGLGTAILANKLSYIFDLRGPSFALDTACSSTIYCLHNAVTALQGHDCDAAIVAGANLITAPEQHLGTMKAGVLSPTSTCHTFDASADGYGRAEGVSALYVKRLSTARRDNDPIRAVIRGTAINANGKTSGITQPSIAGQEEVIRKAYRKAGIDARDTPYVECHGTGTSVGDPMEVEALSRLFPRDRPSPLLLGANKTNLGHSEAASGISAVIKAVLAFEHKQIPATIGVRELNPKLHLDEWNMQVVTKPCPWPTPLHRASINSFGFGGANAHAILESVDSFLPGYSKARRERTRDDSTKTYVLPFSASTDRSLEARVLDLAKRFNEGEQYDFEDVCYTLSKRRSKLPKRGFLLASAASARTDFAIERLVTPKKSVPVLDFGFVFTGQGAQWPRMGAELFEQYPIFAETIHHLDNVLRGLPEAPSWTIKEALLEPAATSKVGDAAFCQPLCTAIQLGITKLLQSWDVKPKVVVGHSSGEIAAAFATGLLTEAQAIIVAFYRGYAVSQITSDGCMLAVGTNADAAEMMIEELSLTDQICVACVNSPESVTLSGSTSGIDALMGHLQTKGTFARKLSTGGRGYHSFLMKEIGAEYEKLVTKAMTGLPMPSDELPVIEDSADDKPVRFFSSVGKGRNALASFSHDTTHFLRPSYWRQNLEHPVQFNTAIKNLVATGDYHLVEIGPHSALQLPIKQIRTFLGVSETALPYSPTLLRGKDANTCMKTLAGELYLIGHGVDFTTVNPTHSASGDRRGVSVVPDLPPYHWTYGPLLWKEPRASIDLRNREYVRHELLGTETLAANGIERSWRNVLKSPEVPWLDDHRLESQVVFPAAAYLAMAMEAMAQIKGWRPEKNLRPSFTFRNVNISSALVVPNGDEETELFTMMYPEKISTASSSGIWYHFSISSFQKGTSVAHVAGSISAVASPQTVAGSTSVDATDYDTWTMGRWYEKLANEGLRFGPMFQTLTSMKTEKARIKPEALSTCKIFQRTPKSSNASFPGTFYAVHPLVIDACLQAAILGGPAGRLDKLKAFLPTFFEHLHVSTPEREHIEGEAYIHSRSTNTGFATRKINVTLKDKKDQVIVDMSNARMSQYSGKMEAAANPSELNRHPCLRVVWKPDITRLDESRKSELDGYLEQWLSDHHHLTENYTVGVAAGLLDLAGHKNPRIRILELGRDCDCKSKQWLDILDEKTDFPRVREWHSGSLSDGELITSPQGHPEKTNKVKLSAESTATYDLVLMPRKETTNKHWSNIATDLEKIISPQGIVIGRSSSEAARHLKNSSFRVFNLVGGVMLALAPQKAIKFEGKHVVFVERSSLPSTLSLDLQSYVKSKVGEGSVRSYSLEGLARVDLPPRTITISLLELEQPLLATMSAEEMNLLRRVTDKTTDLIWLTGASYMSGSSPDLTLASGLSRALMLEQPSLRFAILDIGATTPRMTQAERNRICADVENALFADDVPDDKEFVVRGGLLHISRFVPDDGLNGLFSQRQNQQPREMTLKEASPAKLAIKKVGNMDTIYFQQESEVEGEIPAGLVDIDVKAVSLNAKDIYVLSGKVETRKGTSAIEFSGVVKAVAKDVHDLQPGDRVCVSAPNTFGTTERVPSWACHKMFQNESFEVMPTLPAIYATALYALDDRAHLRAGETILIHSGAGAFGQATIALAQQRGATVYATVSTQDKKDFLASELGLPLENIFQSRDTSFVEGVMTATKGKGVDVVVNSLTGDLLHASWRCCANFGRFVEVGKRDIVDAGKLDMDVFFRNVTFTAFDLTELFYHDDQFYKDIWINKTREALELYRSGAVKPVPIQTFDVSEITQAYRQFSQKNRVGKIVISLENSQSIVKAVPAQYLTTFSANKSYVLIGCLGGLGRSLSKWMFNRGARHFTFLGRSATDKAAAKEVVQTLEKAGATVQVVRGDVSKKHDVVKCMTVSPQPIGGVIQAAMGLHEALFSTMTNEAWHTGIQPKWRGTWNIHEALEGKDSQLDFFLMTSSVSGSVGTATESNYCSANGFLDAFARYRHSLGKPVTSIGFGMISEVGYLHENPEIEALLLRKGIQPLNEEEFLQVLDLALCGQPSAGGMEYDKLARSHILTGLESFGIRKMMEQGFDVSNGTLQDARTVLLSASLDPKEGNGGAAAVSIDASWSKGLPAPVIKALAAGAANASSMNEAILALVCRRFSNLLLMPFDAVDAGKPIASFGMDSMIAAEYRTWFWTVFKVDIPFLDILSSTNHLQTLADMVENELVARIE
ncbi:hypothetical protein GJ744_002603 [Endocarpon pusillum]|uniref:Carrier domain-containing protein n=1 Tax=Endocarpon pusillum TaxID=364733 RepID=A0A8H7AAY3_9EURO|nr:hypothetical protein GJ744_002603 [Endocarpon pusillum]